MLLQWEWAKICSSKSCNFELYCLGVLHHLPHTYDVLKSVVKLLKRGAPDLVYLY
jgi:hypothetical protein